MTFATVLAMGLAALAIGAWRVLAARQMALGNWIGVVALGLWLVVVAAAQFRSEPPRAHSELVQSMDSLAWPEAPQPLPAPPPAQEGSAGVQAAPVESLIGGLEARLAAEPNDAAGWALLAQSYAFMANDAGVERASQRAIELGVDEQSLRERVRGAQRGARSGDLVGQLLHDLRP